MRLEDRHRIRLPRLECIFFFQNLVLRRRMSEDFGEEEDGWIEFFHGGGAPINPCCSLRSRESDVRLDDWAPRHSPLPALPSSYYSQFHPLCLSSTASQLLSYLILIPFALYGRSLHFPLPFILPACPTLLYFRLSFPYHIA